MSVNEHEAQLSLTKMNDYNRAKANILKEAG